MQSNKLKNQIKTPWFVDFMENEEVLKNQVEIFTKILR